MKINAITHTFNNKSHINFSSQKSTENVMHSSVKYDEDYLDINNPTKSQLFFNEVKYWFNTFFNPKEMTYSQSKKRKIKMLTEAGVPYENAKQLSEMKRKDFQQVTDLIMLGMNPTLTQIGKELTEDQVEQAKKVLTRQIEDKKLIKLAKLEPENFNETLQLYDDGVDANSAIFYSECTKSEKEKIRKLLEEGEIPQIAVIKGKNNFDSQKTSILNKLVEKGLPQIIIIDFFQDSNVLKKAIELIDEGISEELIWHKAYYSKEEEKRYEELKQIGLSESNIQYWAELSKEDYDLAKRILKSGTLEDFIVPDPNMGNKEECLRLLDKGYKSNFANSFSSLDKDEKKRLKNFAKKFPIVKEYIKDDYGFSYTNLYELNTDCFTFTKEFFDNGTKITIKNTIYDNGEIVKNRTEKYQNGCITSTINDGSKSVKIEIEKDNSVKNITEYLKDKTGSVYGVLYSENSNILDGVLNTTYYDINDFIIDNEEKRINKNTKNSVKTKGEEISKAVKLPDGSIEYRENYKNNGFTTSRYYKENSKKEEREYSYKITDITGKEILSISTSWKKNADNSVTNIINGNEYHLTYDDKKKIITIQHKDRTKEIDLSKKLAKYPKETLWQIAKTLDVDTLLHIDNDTNQWRYCSDVDSGIDRITKNLFTGKNIEIISHEIGHIKGYNIEYSKEYEDIEKAHQKEIKLFEKYNTYLEEELIKYFSPKTEFSSIAATSEFIAETNMLFNSVGNKCLERSLRIRSQILARYFPETLAKIAEVTKKNSTEPLI